MPTERRRLQVIAGIDGEIPGQVAVHAAWSNSISEFIAERRGLPPLDPVCSTGGLMLWAITWGAFQAWARSDDPDPATYIDRVAQDLADLPLFDENPRRPGS